MIIAKRTEYIDRYRNRYATVRGPFATVCELHLARDMRRFF